MNGTYASEMIVHWKYDGEYSIYDYANEREHLLDETIWGNGLFAVLDEHDQLIGEVTIEFFKDEENYIDNKIIEENPDYPAKMGIGFGLKPALTGQGVGEEFVRDCVDFAIRYYRYSGPIMLGVASFNQRAKKIYERVGFQVVKIIRCEINDEEFEVIRMSKEV